MRRHIIEGALARWRAAERALRADVGDPAALQAQLDAARTAFQELSAEHMASLIDEEHERERRAAMTSEQRGADTARQSSRQTP